LPKRANLEPSKKNHSRKKSSCRGDIVKRNENKNLFSVLIAMNFSLAWLMFCNLTHKTLIPGEPMSRKPKNKSSKKTLSSIIQDGQRAQWNLRPLKRWVTGMSEKVLDVYALPLTRLTEAKIKNLKLKLKSAQTY
jgi:hypothetical protein